MFLKRPYFLFEVMSFLLVKKISGINVVILEETQDVDILKLKQNSVTFKYFKLIHIKVSRNKENNIIEMIEMSTDKC